MIISNVCSHHITDSLCRNGLIAPQYKDSYQYCLDLTFDFIIFHSSLLLIGAAIGQFFPTCCYILTLTPLKIIAGGAHAKTPLICSIISYALYFCVIFLSLKISIPSIVSFGLILLIASGIFLLTPVNHPNKIFDLQKRKSMRRALLIYQIISTIIILILFIYGQEHYLCIILLCNLITYINQIIGHILYQEVKPYET